jgi:hypothetical protein
LKTFNLDRSRIRTIISTYRGGVEVGSWNKIDNCKRKLEVYFDDEVVKLTFYFIDDGTTSIQSKQDDYTSIEIVKYLLKHGVVSSKQNISKSLECTRDYFLALIKHLKLERKATIVKSEKNNKYHLVKLGSKHQDTITFKYYTNGRLQIQGKPLYLYAKTLKYFDEHSETSEDSDDSEEDVVQSRNNVASEWNIVDTPEDFGKPNEAKTILHQETYTGLQAATLLKRYGIKMGRNTLYKELRARDIFDSNIARQKYVDRGYFKINSRKRKGNDRPYRSTLFTPKGIKFVRDLLMEQ